MREVAHDYQPQIQKYLEKEIQCVNSFDSYARYETSIPFYICNNDADVL